MESTKLSSGQECEVLFVKRMRIGLLIAVLIVITSQTKGIAQMRLQNIESLLEEIQFYQDHELQAITYIPEVKELPILKVRLRDVEASNQGDLQGYPSIVNFHYEKYDMAGKRGTGTFPEATYSNLFLRNQEVDFKQVFASKQSYSAENIIDLGASVIGALDGAQTGEVLPHAVTIQSPWRYYNAATEEFGQELPCKDLTGVGGYFVSYYPVLHGIPVISSIGLAFEESASQRNLRRVMTERSEYIYSYYSEDIWSLNGLGIWEEMEIEAQDMPVCSFEKIIQTIEENGDIEAVHSLVLGYVVGRVHLPFFNVGNLFYRNMAQI